MTPDAAGIEAALAAGLAAHFSPGTCVEEGHFAPDVPLVESYCAHVAAALLPVVTQAQAEALRTAADRWTQGAWADVMLPKPTPPAVPVIAYANRFGDWLRARADESGGA